MYTCILVTIKHGDFTLNRCVNQNLIWDWGMCECTVLHVFNSYSTDSGTNVQHELTDNM